MTGAMSHQSIIDRFRGARSDQSLAVLEGFHPLKHAIRFGAKLIEVVSLNVEELGNLVTAYAPDIAHRLDNDVSVVPEHVFQLLAPVPPPTGVIAIARRPEVCLTEMLSNAAASPIVLLENPRNLLNIGASVRVSAAAGAAGVVTTGAQDPWHPAALIAGTGLQYALPVTRATALGPCDRPLVVIDPDGQPLPQSSIPARAILAFGSERDGLSQQLMTSADQMISIPMLDGVSSLNLATAVAVVLYAWKLGN
jgi:tRNA G18 (ribose-2'-O)-methylase SpoU